MIPDQEREELDPWPTPDEIADYERDMAARANDPPYTEAEIDAIVEEWLKRYELHQKVQSDYYAALIRPVPRTPF